MDFTKNLDITMQALSTGAFLSCKSSDAVNTMTISWGYIGVMWGRPYFVVMVRPSRYTYKLMESATNFTVSIPYEKMKNELKICGTKSGFELDKSTIVNFISSKKVSSPIVEGCQMYYECEIRYVQKLNKLNMPQVIVESTYKDSSFHYMYFGEIVSCYSS